MNSARFAWGIVLAVILSIAVAGLTAWGVTTRLQVAPQVTRATGSTGTPEIPSLVGPVGPTGVPGANGAPGSNGPTGETGPVGPPGANGAPGSNGPTGATGLVGPPGATGMPGATGAAGVGTALSHSLWVFRSPSVVLSPIFGLTISSSTPVVDNPSTDATLGRFGGFNLTTTGWYRVSATALVSDTVARSVRMSVKTYPSTGIGSGISSYLAAPSTDIAATGQPVVMDIVAYVPGVAGDFVFPALQVSSGDATGISVTTLTVQIDRLSN